MSLSRWLPISAACVCLLALGCGSDDEPVADDSITITLEDLTLSPPRVESWLLECDPSGGSLPDSEAACERLAVLGEPFAEPPSDEACAEIFGGPESLTITGTFAGRSIDRTFSKANSCEIDRFDQIVATLGMAELIG